MNPIVITDLTSGSPSGPINPPTTGTTANPPIPIQN